MSKVKIQGNASGTGIFSIAAPATNTDRTITLPDVDATVMTTAGGTFTGNLGMPINSNINFSGNWGFKVGYQDNQGGDHYYYINKRSSTVETQVMKIHGELGTVNLPMQPGFFARDCSTTDFNAGTGSTNVLKSGTVQFNIGSCYNATNGRFTAPIAGRYFYTAALLVNTGTGRLEAAMAINDTNIISMNGTGTTYDGPTLTTVVYLAAGDYLTLKRVSGTAYGSHSNVYMSAFLLG